MTTTRAIDVDRPPAEPVLVEVPEMTYLMLDGKGDPNGPEYPDRHRGPVRGQLSGGHRAQPGPRPCGSPAEAEVGPLEGLWWLEGEDYDVFDPRTSDRTRWRWTAITRRPDDYPHDLHADALARAARKVGEETTTRLEGRASP